MSLHPMVTKLTVQAFAVGALIASACAGLFLHLLTGEQFMILAVAASGWAFNRATATPSA